MGPFPAQAVTAGHETKADVGVGVGPNGKFGVYQTSLEKPLPVFPVTTQMTPLKTAVEWFVLGEKAVPWGEICQENPSVEDQRSFNKPFATCPAIKYITLL